MSIDWMSKKARLCPRCKLMTEERTSTNNSFCRGCDYIFNCEGSVYLTQAEIKTIITTIVNQSYEEQLVAMRDLGIYPMLGMRAPGDWYVTLPSVEIGDGYMLSSVTVVGAATPQEAVQRTWERITTLQPPYRLVIWATSKARREVRWSGHMWASIGD